MRRLLAIALCLFFSSSLISPLLALTAGPGANLPACCRRNGAHHCTGNMPMAGDSATGSKLTPIPERCPAFPQLVNSAPHTQLAAPAASLLFASVIRYPCIRRQTEPRARIALDLSRHKRGPPTLL